MRDSGLAVSTPAPLRSTIGGRCGLRNLVQTLATRKRDALDDGRVRERYDSDPEEVET